MAVTKYQTVRDSQISDIHAITPTSHAGEPFRVHRTPQEFEDWCEQNPAACFRRFELRKIFSDSFPEVSNTDHEEEIAEQELVVAYPAIRTGSYKTPRDRDVLINEDKHALRKVVGITGYRNYSNAAIIGEDEITVEPLGEDVLLLMIPLTFAFYRTV